MVALEEPKLFEVEILTKEWSMIGRSGGGRRAALTVKGWVVGAGAKGAGHRLCHEAGQARVERGRRMMKSTSGGEGGSYKAVEVRNKGRCAE
jgi:hypothetical protein